MLSVVFSACVTLRIGAETVAVLGYVRECSMTLCWALDLENHQHILTSVNFSLIFEQYFSTFEHIKGKPISNKLVRKCLFFDT